MITFKSRKNHTIRFLVKVRIDCFMLILDPAKIL